MGAVKINHDDVAAMLPEMKEHLASLQPYERAISLDNWAAMVGRTYSQLRVAMKYLDKTFLKAYTDHRREYYRLIESELKALPDFTIKYTQPVMDKYGLKRKDVQRVRLRLNLKCAAKYSRGAERVQPFLQPGLSLMDVAEAAGMHLYQVQGLLNRGHLDKYAEFSHAKRLCRNGRNQRVVVVARLKGTEKSHDRSKSRR